MKGLSRRGFDSLHLHTSIRKPRINNQIRAPRIRLIDEKGKQLGIIGIIEAQRIAQEREMDLVEVAANAQPPVCRLMDFGKYQYRIIKASHKPKRVQIKGIRIGLSTSKHDLDFKAKRMEKFLQQGHRVRIEMILRGREKAHQDLAREKISDFIKSIEGIRIEEPIKRAPRGLTIVIKK